MENSLSQYVGNNYKDSIAKVEVVQGIAKDSGNPYYAVEISFINGYTKRMFLRSDEQFAWTNAFDQLTTQQQVEL